MTLMIPKRRTHKRKRRDPNDQPHHRQWIRGHHCSVPGCENTNIVAAHVRQGQNGVTCGTSKKPPDWWTIPLCWEHHEEQGNLYEAPFERKYGIDMRAIAQALAKKSPHRKRWEE